MVEAEHFPYNLGSSSRHYRAMTPQSSIYPLVEPAELVRRVGEASLLRMIRQSIPHDHEDLFERRYIGLLERVAAQVQECPITESVFGDAGGALRYAMTIGFGALRLSQAYIYCAQLGMEARRVLEPQYVYASYAAAVLSVAGLPHVHLEVTLPDGTPWHPAHMQVTLLDWIRAQRQNGYLLRWRARPDDGQRSCIPFMAGRMLGDGLVDDLHHQVIVDLIASINPPETPVSMESPLTRTVRQALQKGWEIEEKESLRRVRARDAINHTDESLTAAYQSTRAQIDAEIQDKPDSTPPPQPGNAGGGDGIKKLPNAIQAMLETWKGDLTTNAQLAKLVRINEDSIRMSKRLPRQYGTAPESLQKALEEAGLIVKAHAESWELADPLANWLRDAVKEVTS